MEAPPEMVEERFKDFESVVTRPADFDGFWDGVLSQAEEIPLNPEVRHVPLRSTPQVDVYEAFYDSLDDLRIACWYCVPKEGNGPYPAIIQVPGYVSDPPLSKSMAKDGYVVLNVGPRGKLRSNSRYNPGYPGLLTHNIVDRNTYSYRGFYVDAIRSVDFLLGRDEVDPKRISVIGHSQGGGLTIVVAAMRREIVAASSGAPYLCGFIDSARLTHSNPYQEINDYLRLYPEREKAVAETLAYFDTINFAPLITCPTIVNIGLQDDVCPPETGWVAFNKMKCPKRLYSYDNCNHDSGKAEHDPIIDAFLREHLM